MYRTYGNRSLAALAVLLWAALASPGLADSALDQYSVASGHYTQSRWDLAADEFQRFLKEYPGHERTAKATFFLAEALMQAGRPADAKPAFEAYLAVAPDGSFARQAAFRVGEAALLDRQNDAAEKNLSQFVERNPKDPLCAYALPYLGDLALDRGDWRQARRRYESALQQFPAADSCDDARFGLARAHQAAVDEDPKALDAALVIYQELAAKKSSKIAHRARFYLAALHFKRREYRDAIRHWRVVEADFPQSRYTDKARLGRARALYELKQYDEARPLLEQLVERHDMEVDAKYWLGMILRAEGEHQQAADLLRRTANEFSSHSLASGLRYAAAETLIQAADYPASIQVLEEDSGELDDPSRYLLALAYQGAKHHEKSLKTLVGLQPRDEVLAADVRAARGHSLYRLERFEESVLEHEAYLQARPDGAAAERSRAELAICYGNLKQMSKARAMLEELQAKHPGSPWVAVTTNRLANVARSSGQADAAGELYKSLGSGTAGKEFAARGLLGLGWTQFSAGKFEQAAETFGKLLVEHPHDPHAAEAAWMKGQCFERQGKLDAALAMYRQVIDKHPETAAHAPALMAAARLHDRLQQDEQAVSLYERLLKEHANLPELDEVLYGYGWALRDLHRDEDADRYFRQLHDEFPKSTLWPDATYRLAERALAVKDYGLALERITALEASGAAGDLVPHLAYLRTQVLLGQADWAEAELALAAVVEQYPEQDFALQAEYWLAECDYRQQQYEAAGEKFRTLLANSAGKTDAWLAMVPLRYAQCLGQQDRWDEATEVASRIAADYPGFGQQYEADYLLGRCHASSGDFQNAREAYGRVISSVSASKSETAAMAQWMIGETYFHQKNYDAALREYLRGEILHHYPKWQAASLLQAGKCYEHLNQIKAATDLYARLLKNHGESEFADEAAKRLRMAQQSTARRP